MQPLKRKKNKIPIKEYRFTLSNADTTVNTDFTAVVDFIFSQWLTACVLQPNSVVMDKVQRLFFMFAIHTLKTCTKGWIYIVHRSTHPQ